MKRSYTRRQIITASAGAAVVAPLAPASPAAAMDFGPPPGPVLVFPQPKRILDSRHGRDGPLPAGKSISVGFSGARSIGSAVAVVVNVTVTGTRRRGYLTVFGGGGDKKRGDDAGRVVPDASNINWWEDGQTFANLAVVPIGDDRSIEIAARGSGSTHVIVDLQALVLAADAVPTL